jgi:hypothetical protein
MIRSEHPLVHIDPQTYSPRRSLGPMHLPLRPLYPSTRVNLSEIPATQHVPTPSFPLPMELPTLSESQSVGTTREASLTPIRASGDQESINETAWTPSIFENDNRFPVRMASRRLVDGALAHTACDRIQQRSVKFVPVGGGDDLSLMHSTSPLPVSSQSNSPSKSPSRAGGLSVDAIRKCGKTLVRRALLRLDCGGCMQVDPFTALVQLLAVLSTPHCRVLRLTLQPLTSSISIPDDPCDLSHRRRDLALTFGHRQRPRLALRVEG